MIGIRDFLFCPEDYMKIGTEYADGRLILYLEGELDHHNAKPAMKAIEQAMEEFLPRQCVLDMSGLTFMDSSGIALILKAHKLAGAQGGQVCVENPPRQVLRVMETSGIERIVPIAQKIGKE